MPRLNRVLPELIDTPEAAVHRLEISHGGENLVFERRGPSRWQMRKPLDVAAEPGPLENLVRNLKDLRRLGRLGRDLRPGRDLTGWLRPRQRSASGETGPPARPPDRAPARHPRDRQGHDRLPLRPCRGRRGAIDVIDKKLRGGHRSHRAPVARVFADAGCRPSRLPAWPFIAIGPNIQAQRGRGGRWRLTAPIVVPANGAKIESALAALSSIRVVEDGQGIRCRQRDRLHSLRA